MQCSKCNSENTQRLEVVYQGGTQNISSTSNLDRMTGSTRGTSQSVLAGNVSPPEKQKTFWSFVMLVVGYFCLRFDFSLMTGFGILLIGVGGYFAYTARQFNFKKWPGLYQYWRESWLCHKCGNIYHQP
jgi:hypothetical protein